MSHFAEPENRRVYTDERFPHMEIHNYGKSDFHIFEVDPATGRMDESGGFTAYENKGVDAVSEEFARRRSAAFFERMASRDLSGEYEDVVGPEPEAQPEPSSPIRSLSQRLKWPAGGKPVKGVNPLVGMREMTRQDIDDIIAAARAEKDPAKAAALRQQATSMMAQEESVAQRIARILLSL